MATKFWLIVALCLLGFEGFAQSMEGIEVLEVSASKKSILINRGHAENIRNGDRSKLYIKDLSEGIESPRFVYVGEGEAIKVKNNISYWFLRKIKSFRHLNKNQKLVMVRQAKDPRRPFITRRTLKVQGRAEDQDYYEVSEDKGIPEDLVFEEQDFIEGQEVKKTKATTRQDIELTRFKKMIKSGSEYDEDFDQVTDRMIVPATEGDDRLIEAIEKAAEDKIFDSTTSRSVPKYNELKYGLRSLYKDNIHEPGLNMAFKGNVPNIRESEKLANASRENVSPGALERIKKEGPRFSKDMTDKQLRDYLVTTGIAQELRRQKRALEERVGQEFTLRYITNLTDNTSEEGGSFSGIDYGISFSYEWHLGNTLRSLNNWTVEAEIERGISFFDVGGVNVRVTEGSLKGFVNWYFFNPPSSLYKYMPYIGVGFKRGNGDMESEELSQSYNLQVVGVPMANFGLKYRWSSGDEKVTDEDIGYGVNLQLRYESLRYNVTDFLEDNIDDVYNLSQLRFAVGLNVYF